MSETPRISAPQTALRISLRRRITDHVMTGVAVLTVILVLVPLVAIFAYVVYRGIGSINWAFLTQTPKPVGEAGGGMANAIVGSALMLALASIIGVALGVGAGIYLAEYGRNRLGDSIRFTADVLSGVPSIVIGIVAYSIVVLSQKHFSALADDPLHHSAHCNFRRDHRNYAGLCPRGRRNRAVALHCAGQSILEPENQSADCGPAVADIQLRSFPLRRLAPAGVGGRARAHYSYRYLGCGSTLRRAPWYLRSGIVYGRWDPGRKPECLVRQDPGLVRRQTDGGGQPCHGAHWSVGLRQVHVHPLPESHARDHSRSACDG